MEYALTSFSRTTQHEKDIPAILSATLVNMVCPSLLAICAGFSSPLLVVAQPYYFFPSVQIQLLAKQKQKKLAMVKLQLLATIEGLVELKNKVLLNRYIGFSMGSNLQLNGAGISVDSEKLCGAKLVFL